MSGNLLELITGILSFLFTILILSYLIGDNLFFRVAVYIFVGVSAGYTASVAWHHVLWPKLFQPIVFGTMSERLLAIIPLILAIFLLAKLSPRSARLGNPAMAFLVGTGAAVAIGGAVLGTLIPQTQASINLYEIPVSGSILEHLFEGSIVLVGTLTTLVYFHFGAKSSPYGPKRNQLIHILSLIGQVFIAFTFGALFAGVYAAAMTALIERVNFIWTFLISLF